VRPRSSDSSPGCDSTHSESTYHLNVRVRDRDRNRDWDRDIGIRIGMRLGLWIEIRIKFRGSVRNQGTPLLHFFIVQYTTCLNNTHITHVQLPQGKPAQ